MPRRERSAKYREARENGARAVGKTLTWLQEERKQTETRLDDLLQRWRQEKNDIKESSQQLLPAEQKLRQRYLQQIHTQIKSEGKKLQQTLDGLSTTRVVLASTFQLRRRQSVLTPFSYELRAMEPTRRPSGRFLRHIV